MSLRDALLIGCAQALAIVPGTSRSGATIAAALFLGHRREAAARFSFLLALPITAGAALVKVPHLLRDGGDDGPVLAGMAGGRGLGLPGDPAAARPTCAPGPTRPFVLYRFAFAALVWGVVLWRSGVLR